MVMKIPVSEFKAKCTKILREAATAPYTVEVTNRGKVIALVTAPAPEQKPNPKEFFGSLKGTVTYVSAEII
jgi:prevent-host-death family protein